MKLSDINFGSTGIMVGSYDNPKQKGESLKNICSILESLVNDGKLISLLIVDAGSLYKSCYLEALVDFFKEQEEKEISLPEKECLSWTKNELEIICSAIDKDLLRINKTIKDEKILEKIQNSNSYVMDFMNLCTLFPDEFKKGIERFESFYGKDMTFKAAVDLGATTFGNKQFVTLKKIFSELDLESYRKELLPCLINAATKFIKLELAFREVIIHGLKINYEFYPSKQIPSMKRYQYLASELEKNTNGKWIVLEGKNAKEINNSKFFLKEAKETSKDIDNSNNEEKMILISRIIGNISLGIATMAVDEKFGKDELIEIEKEIKKILEQYKENLNINKTNILNKNFITN